MKEHGALAPLKSALYMLQRHENKLTPSLVRSITDNVHSALEVLRKGDPLTERLAFIGLALRQATEIRVAAHGRGKKVEHVAVIDQDLFTVAMKMLHSLP
jgi:hypothetical protein